MTSRLRATYTGNTCKATYANAVASGESNTFPWFRNMRTCPNSDGVAVQYALLVQPGGTPLMFVDVAEPLNASQTASKSLKLLLVPLLVNPASV